MTMQQQSPTGTAYAGDDIEITNNYSGAAMGWITFAAVVMIMIGFFQIVDGIAAIANDDILVTTRNYAFAFDTTAWGWIHLVMGSIVVLARFGLFTGNLAARIVAIAMATLAAIANFLWLPYYPIWSVIVIALAVTVIWALTAHGRDIAA